jgi:hypothetical protein
MALTSTQLTTTNSTAVYTSSGSTCCTVIYLCNTSSSSVTVTINVGTTAATSNIIYNTHTINGYDTYIIASERIMFDDGQKIFVTASAANAISVTVSYIEV